MKKAYRNNSVSEIHVVYKKILLFFFNYDLDTEILSISLQKSKIIVFHEAELDPGCCD